MLMIIIDTVFSQQYHATWSVGDEIFFGEIHLCYRLAIRSCSGTISFSSPDQNGSRKQRNERDQGHDGTPDWLINSPIEELSN